jgi:hypothetical protein
MSDLKEMHSKLKEVIDDIDVKLDSLQDQEGATKRRITNDLVASAEAQWKPASEGIIAQISGLEPAVLVGVYRGIVNALNSAFNATATEFVDKAAEEAPKTEPLITVEEATELSKTRSELYQQIKMVVSLAKTMDGIDLEMPKTRRGSKGKRGKRALNQMIWAINGEELNPQPKIPELATALGFDKAKDLTAFLKSKGVNTTNPEGGKLEVTLEDERILTGYIPNWTPPENSEGDESDEEDEDYDDDESGEDDDE